MSKRLGHGGSIQIKKKGEEYRGTANVFKKDRRRDRDIGRDFFFLFSFLLCGLMMGDLMMGDLCRSGKRGKCDSPWDE